MGIAAGAGAHRPATPPLRCLCVRTRRPTFLRDRLGGPGTYDRDLCLRHVGDARVDRDVDAEGGKRLPGLRGKLRRVRGQDARPPFEEEDAGVRRVDRAELATQRVAPASSSVFRPGAADSQSSCPK
jgi:hypothetical protein